MRRSGVLLHPTALPGTPACGSLGQAAHAWVDALADHGIGAWQLLPLAPTDGTGSPYSSPSGFALNPWLLDAEQLVADGLLEVADLATLPTAGDATRFDPALAERRAEALADALLRRAPQWPELLRRDLEQWRDRQSFWLPDHCRFMVLRRLHGQQPWWCWPTPFARRERAALAGLERDHAAALEREVLLQWQLQRQWQSLLQRARSRGVEVIGDLPFYVAHDSADVWSRRRLFSVRRDGRLTLQSGVPPDYFSATGQLWGTPVYRWPLHRLSRFHWWMRRLERQLEFVDLLRLDHFRALEAAWCVPGGDSTAETGTWRRSPGSALLRRLQATHGGDHLPLIAEDLGVITPAVEALRDSYRLPGMKILQFAFDGNPDNPYLPENFRGDDWVVYTGTHDNATCIGWWNGLSAEERGRVEAHLAGPVQAPGWQLLELALASRAELAVVPLQDLLCLGDEARFNSPGTTAGNWSWRLSGGIATITGPLQGLGEMARRYGRR
ncbi:MAG: 4-alpha-glucanotransferase [Cyanobacteriota bacterium]|jgi:4-alpha-glucanotransferase